MDKVYGISMAIGIVFLLSTDENRNILKLLGIGK
jgi:hypothetical protein